MTAERLKLSRPDDTSVADVAVRTKVMGVLRPTRRLLRRLLPCSCLSTTLICYVALMSLFCGGSLLAQSTPLKKDSKPITFEDADTIKVLDRCFKEFARIKTEFKDRRDYEAERDAKAEVAVPACEELWTLSQSKRNSVTELECLAGILRIEQEASLILGKGGWIKDKALERLSEAYVDHPRMRLVVGLLMRSSLMESAGLLQDIIDRHPDSATRTLAGWSLLYAGALAPNASLTGVDRAVLIQVCDMLTRNIADLSIPPEAALAAIKRARTKMESLDVGCAAMEIAGKSLGDKPVKLSDLRGKWVVIKFFGGQGRLAPLDREALAAVREQAQKVGMKDVAVLGVTGLSPAAAQQVFPKTDGCHCIVGEDGARAIVDWQVDRLFIRGATYIVDRRGIITHADPFRPIAPELEYALSKEGNRVKLLAQDLLATGAKWQFWDQGVPPAADWNQPRFSTSNWKSGSSPLGYGIPEVATQIAPQKKMKAAPVCSWFRIEFDVKAAITTARYLLTVRADDAAVVWLNGVEVARSELLPDSTTDQTPAREYAETYGVVAAAKHYRIPRELVRPGRNVLAVRLHQAKWSGMDAFLDATLTSQFPDPGQVPSTDWDRQEWAHYLQCLEELTDSERQTLQQLSMNQGINEYVRYSAFTTLVAAGARSGKLVDKLPKGMEGEQRRSLEYQLKDLVPIPHEWRTSKQTALNLLPRAKAVTHLLPQRGDVWFTRALLNYRAGELAQAKADLETSVKLERDLKALPQHSLSVLIAHGLSDKAAAQKAFEAGQQFLKGRDEWDIRRHDAAFWREASAAIGQ